MGTASSRSEGRAEPAREGARSFPGPASHPWGWRSGRRRQAFGVTAQRKAPANEIPAAQAARMAPSSSGQDARFSTWKGGFNSLWGYHQATAECSRSSVDQSIRLRSGRSQVRVLPRAPTVVGRGRTRTPAWAVARRDGEGCAHASLAMLRRLPKGSSRPCRERQHEPDPVRTGSVETVAQHGRVPRPGRSSVRIRPVSSI